MRHGFENQLHQFNEIAKDLSAPELPDETRKRLNDVLDWHIGKAAERFRTPQETQRFVFEMQEKKRQVMERLKNRLRQIDNPFQEREPDSRPVRFENNGFTCEFNGKDVPITEGEILTDVEWGINYALDPITVPKVLRKRYLVEVAKRELTHLLNEQILENEIRTERPRGDHGIALAYQELRAWENKNDSNASGQYAEREIRNFLRKLAIDSGVDFRVIQGDAHQDVELKIDFVLVVPNKIRGVSVEKKDDLQEKETENLRLGIQFTINADKQRVAKKKKQIKKSKAGLAPTDKIDDIVFVKMNLKKNLDNVNNWFKEGKPPGGPEKNWPEDRKVCAIDALLKNLIPAEQITSLIAKYRTPKISNKTPKRTDKPMTTGKSERQPAATAQEQKTAAEIEPTKDGKLKVGDIVDYVIFQSTPNGYRGSDSQGRTIILRQDQFVKENVPYQVRIVNRNKKNPVPEAIILGRVKKQIS